MLGSAPEIVPPTRQPWEAVAPADTFDLGRGGAEGPDAPSHRARDRRWWWLTFARGAGDGNR